MEQNSRLNPVYAPSEEIVAREVRGEVYLVPIMAIYLYKRFLCNGIIK